MKTRHHKETAPHAPGPTVASGELQHRGSPVIDARWHAAAGVVAGILLVYVGFMSAADVRWCADSFSDMNDLLAGENYARLGFFKLHLLPVHYFTPSADNPTYYLHYPPLDAIINGVFQAMGIHSLFVMRLFCGALVVAGLFCTYRAFAPLVGPLAALCGLAWAGGTGFFSAYGVSLHLSYDTFSLGLFLLFFMRAVHSEGPTRGARLGAWLPLLVGALVSFEFILYAQIFAWVYVLATGQLRRRWRLRLLLATAPLLAVGLKFLQNCWGVGLTATLTDGLGYGEYEERGRWFWLTLLPERLLERSQRAFFWSWPALLLLAALVMGLLDRLRDTDESRRRARALLAGLLLAPLGWYLFMPRHAWIHLHVTGQFLLLFAAVLGCTVALVLRWAFGSGQPLVARVLGVAALLALIGGEVQSIGWRLSDRKPGLSDILEALGPNALPPHTAALHNAYTADFGYFLQRPAWHAPLPNRPFPACVTDLQRRLPADWPLQYYVFLPGTNDPDTLRVLAENCVGRRLRAPQVLLFDISPLQRPENERPPLPPDVHARQLRGEYPEWQVPGFEERLAQITARYGTAR